MKKMIMLVLLLPLLTACWDEVLYKDLTIVPLMGLEGEDNEMTMYFSYPTIDDEQVQYDVTIGEGTSIRTARNNAYLHSNEMLDVSQVEVFLISEETVKDDLYKYVDPIYRVPRNRLNGHIVIVKGPLDRYFNQEMAFSESLPEFYKGTLETAIEFSSVPDLNFQNAIRIYFDESQDLALPAMVFSEELNSPTISGVGLFSGKDFTGEYLNIEQSKVLVLLSKTASSKFLQFEYEWKKDGEKYPFVVEVVSKKDKTIIDQKTIRHNIEIKVAVEEFPHDNLGKRNKVDELNKFLSQEITKDFQEVIGILQEAKSDAVGYGKTVRAFHPDLWARGEWQETFSTMDIDVNVKVKIVRTGLLG